MPKIIPLYASGKKGLSDEPVVKLKYIDNEIKIIYIFPSFTMLDSARNIKGRLRSFQEVKISGAGFYSVDSEPLLPSFGRYVQIPAGYSVVHDRHRRYNLFEFRKKVLITWAEESVADEGRVEFDEETYSRNEFMPKENVLVHREPYYADGYKVILVQVRPLQYNPKRELLRGYGKIIVTITLEQAEMDQKEWALTDQTTNLEGFGNLLVNPKRRVFEEIQTAQTSSVDIPAEHRGPELLIIYGDNLKTPAEKLKEWKIKRGIETEINCINEIPGSRENDTDEVKRKKIKEYIRHIREKPFSRLRYVLLFGDVDKIPVSQKKGDNGETTDHYFYTQKDAKPLECLLPWVSGGRIPVEKNGDAMCVVDQIIRYEKEPPCDPNYYKKMTVAGYFQDYVLFEDPLIGKKDGRAEQNFIKTMEHIREHMISWGFEVNRVYFSETPKNLQYIYRDGTPVPQEVIDDIIVNDKNKATEKVIRQINEGQLIVCHRGHGRKYGWKEPPFKINDLESISNDFPCILFNISCLTGDFDEPSKSFAEQLLTLNKGTPSLIAANFLSKRWRNDSMAKALFDSIWPGIIPTFPGTTVSYPVKSHRFGDILNYAKSYILVEHGANLETKVQFEVYHIIGDPTLEIWGTEPSALLLRARIVNDTLDIKMSTCPKGSVLTIWDDDKLLKRIEPSSSCVRIALMDLQKAPPYSVCFAAPGYRFAEV